MPTHELANHHRQRPSRATGAQHWMTQMTLPWALCVAALCLLQPRAAHANSTLRDASAHHRPQMLSVFTGFHVGFYRGAGLPVTLSGRYYYPIVPDGFGRTINDEFGIEGGLDLLFNMGSSDFGVGLPVAGLYDLHFTDTFDAYAKLGFGIRIDHRAHAFPYAAVGMRLRFSDALYFRVEGGYPLILVGLGFGF